MQPEIHFHPEYHSIIIRRRGIATFQRIVLYLKSLLAHPQWSPGHNVLVDCRELSVRHFPTRAIYDISDLFKLKGSQLGSGRWAFIMKSRIEYGLARMWQLLTEDEVSFTSRICMTMQEALEWLNLPEEMYCEDD